MFYTPKPRFEWPHRHGQAYRVVLWRVPTAIGESRTLVYDRVNYLDATWSPSNELDFATRYELFVYDEALRIVTSWAFTIGFQPATIMFPAPGASVRSLLPEIRIRPFEHPHVYYGFEVSDTQRFERIIDSGYLAHADSIKTFPGADDKLGTRDDIKYVAWPIAKALSPDKRYWYRVRGYHFTADELANRATAPAKADAVGTSEKIGSFTIPAQTGSETLANITQLTRDTSETAAPALSKHLELSFVSMLPARGAEIRVARAQLQRGVPTFDSAREEFTSSVRGSSDVWPQWDIDGEGMFFASDRAGGASNIWYKRRDTRGYTQLTFHEQTAWYPSLSKDGSKVAYQVQNNQSASGWSVWVIARDGRSATELGSGEQPRWSPDGKKIAFAQRDARGVKQLWLMDANGGNRVQLTSESCAACNGNEMPVWHPSGKRLVFVSDIKTENRDIWMIDIEGGRLVQLTNHLGNDMTPELTPDGRYLLFSSTRGGEVHHIWMGELGAN